MNELDNLLTSSQFPIVERAQLGKFDTSQAFFKRGPFEICCVGFNHELCELSAVLRYRNLFSKLTDFPICSEGEKLRVGFWLEYGDAFHFIGESTVHAFNMDQGYMNGEELHYSVTFPLAGEAQDNTSLALLVFPCLQSLPLRVHAVGVISDIPLVATNFGGQGLMTAPSVFNGFIEYSATGRSGGLGLHFSRPDGEATTFQVHATHMSDGRILVMSGSAANISKSHYDENGYLWQWVAIFDPEVNRYTKLPNIWANNIRIGKYYDEVYEVKEHIPFDMFCCNTNTLPDGRILIYGGTQKWAAKDGYHEHGNHMPALRCAGVFDPRTGEFFDLGPMKRGRWYPSGLVQSDGRVIIMNGHVQEFDYHSHTNTQIEFYVDSPIDKTDKIGKIINVTEANGKHHIDTSSQGNPGAYERLHLMPNGEVFCVNPAPAAGRREWASHLFDFMTFSWRAVADGGPASSTFLREWNYTSVLLPFRLADRSGDHYPARVLAMYRNTPLIIEPLAKDARWEILGGAHVRGLTNDRLNGHAVLLPDGTVAFVGGSVKVSYGKKLNSNPKFVHDPTTIDQLREHGINDGGDFELENIETEIYDPKSGDWTLGPKTQNVRDYHTSALLLRDGRIFIGGGVPNDQGGDEDARDNSHEILTPAYLWRGPRPKFTVSRKVLSPGTAFQVVLGRKWLRRDIGMMTLIRTCSSTHAFSYDQRAVELPIEGGWESSNLYSAVPANSALVPPGFYFLFLVSVAGAPSVAEMVQIVV